MLGIIERVAHFADIDTRRAMGFLPRKLQPAQFDLPERFFRYGNVKIIFDRDIRLTVFHYENAHAFCWSFGCGGPTWDQRGYVFRRSGRIEIYGVGQQNSLHPDFNEDGTIKNWQTV
jgi:hypothetical protein